MRHRMTTLSTAARTARRPRRGETRERILATAERLFAERGIEAVSVRSVLAEAGVNVALAHRHFGSRDGLVDEILRRAIGPLNERRVLLLEEVEARGPRASVEDVLRAMFAPGIRWLFEQPRRARLVAQLQASTDPRLRALHRQHFEPLIERFAQALVRTVDPRLGARDFVCRFTFVLGAGQATAFHAAEMMRIARQRFGAEAVPGERDFVEQIVAFCAAGLRAEVARSSPAATPPGRGKGREGGARRGAASGDQGPGAPGRGG
jgi:AcrR family transcriptional regulator